ncbi:MAG TPA: thioredoxin family protein [Polyangiales bacterium]|nr:thioredoxin family protein [Polyangiales bacterium]
MVAYSKGMPVGTRAPEFSLPGVDGKTYSLDSFRDARLLVVIFTCNHCPYAQALESRFIELQRDYLERGVRFVGINPNDAASYAEDDFEHMKERAKRNGWNFPYLRDESQSVARAYDAACTPDIFVFDGDRALRYNGRCDDNWRDPGQVRQRDLKRALEQLLAGKPLDFEVHPALGCSIKWKG